MASRRQVVYRWVDAKVWLDEHEKELWSGRNDPDFWVKVARGEL